MPCPALQPRLEWKALGAHPPAQRPTSSPFRSSNACGTWHGDRHGFSRGDSEPTATASCRGQSEDGVKSKRHVLTGGGRYTVRHMRARLATLSRCTPARSMLLHPPPPHAVNQPPPINASAALTCALRAAAATGGVWGQPAGRVWLGGAPSSAAATDSRRRWAVLQ